MNRINKSLTYEDINMNFTFALGGLMMFGGMLCALNSQRAGPFVVILCATVMMATMDNPLVRE